MPRRSQQHAPTSDRRVWVAALVLAVAPFATSAVALLISTGDEYRPAGDLAMTEMHVRDVGRHEVLVGLHSRPFWSHPGPLLFYLVAPFYRLSGGSSLGMVLGALTINAVAVGGMLIVARRRGGAPLVLCSLLGSSLLVRALGPEALGDAWNLTITVLPFALLAFLTWSMLEGERWALPAATVVTTFLVQTHISFLVLAVPLLVVGGSAMVLAAVRPGASPHHRRSTLRTVGLTAFVGALLWSPPLVDVVINAPSNARQIYRYFSDPGESAHSLLEGWRVMTGQFGLAPEWFVGGLAPTGFGESQYLTSSPVPVLLAPTVLGAVVVWRCSRHSRGWVVTLGLMVALGVVSVARTVGPVAAYRLRPTWVPPALAVVLVLWASWQLVAPRLAVPGRRRVGAVALAAAAFLGTVNVVAALRAGTPHAADSEVVATLAEPITRTYGHTGSVVVVDEVPGIAGPWYSRGLVLELERQGIRALVPPDQELYFSPSRVHRGGPVTANLLVATGESVSTMLDRSGLRLLARWTAVPLDVVERVERQIRAIRAGERAGRIDALSAFGRERVLAEQLRGDGETTAHDVAVFLLHPSGAGTGG